MPYTPRVREERQKRQLNPVWRGIGFILLILFTVGSYYAAGWLLELNAARQWVPIPGEWDPLYVKVGAAAVVSFTAYNVMNIIYGMFAPPPVGPLDVRGPRR